MASFAQTDAVHLRTPNSTTTTYTRLTIETTTSGPGTASIYFTNAYLGVGSTPSVPLDVFGTATAAMRIRGTNYTTAGNIEMADLYVNATGGMLIDLTPGDDTGQYFDLRPEDDTSGWGFILRESDGTGSTVYLNIYVVDAATDYVNFPVSAANSVAHFSIAGTSDFGFVTVNPDGVQVNAAVTEGLRSVDNVRLGVVGGTPRIMMEDEPTATLIEVENAAGVFTISEWTSGGGKVARLQMSTTEGYPSVHWRPEPDSTRDLGDTTNQWRYLYCEDADIFTTTTTGNLNASDSGAKTAATYALYLDQASTNTTTDAINKNGLYVSSTGAWTGATTATDCHSYGIYVAEPTGADNDVGVHVDADAYILGGDMDVNGSGAVDITDVISAGNLDAGTSALTATNFAGTDANADGFVNAMDQALINGYAFGALTLDQAHRTVGKWLADTVLSVRMKDGTTTPPSANNSGYVEQRSSQFGSTLTSELGVLVVNGSAATVGAQLQYTPVVRWQGNGWSTGSTASQPVEFRSYGYIIAANPIRGYLTFEPGINNAYTQNGFVIDTEGQFGIGTTDPTLNLTVVGDFATRAANLSLANGNNDNIAIGARSFIRVTGPTAAFTIRGIASGFNGKRVVIYNTVAQNMTINHEDVNSTAANRIRTMTGAAITATTEGIAELIYDATLSRWLLMDFKQ